MSSRTPLRMHLCAACVGALYASTASAAINLTLVPTQTTLGIGSSLGIDILARGSTLAGQGFLSFQVIFSWDPTKLRLTGVSTNSVPDLLSASFMSDAYGINESPLPSDGSAILVGFGPFFGSIQVPGSSSAGLSISTLQFVTLAPSTSTTIGLLSSAGSPVGRTIVFGDTGPNVNVTGTLTGGSVQIVPGPASGFVLGGLGLAAVRRARRRTAVGSLGLALE